MQIKTTVRYHFTLVRMPSSKSLLTKKKRKKTTKKKFTNNQRGRGCGEKGTLLYCWWDYKLVQPLWTVWRFLQKNIELPNDPLIPLLGIYLEETILQKETGTPVFIAALFTVAKTWKHLNIHLQRDG